MTNNPLQNMTGTILLAGAGKLGGATAVSAAFADQIAELSTGLEQLYGGSQALSSGIGKLNDGAGKLQSGQADLVEGIVTLGSPSPTSTFR